MKCSILWLLPTWRWAHFKSLVFTPSGQVTPHLYMQRGFTIIVFRKFRHCIESWDFPVTLRFYILFLQDPFWHYVHIYSQVLQVYPFRSYIRKVLWFYFLTICAACFARFTSLGFLNITKFGDYHKFSFYAVISNLFLKSSFSFVASYIFLSFCYHTFSYCIFPWR